MDQNKNQLPFTMNEETETIQCSHYLTNNLIIEFVIAFLPNDKLSFHVYLLNLNFMYNLIVSTVNIVQAMYPLMPIISFVLYHLYCIILINTIVFVSKTPTTNTYIILDSHSYLLPLNEINPCLDNNRELYYTLITSTPNCYLRCFGRSPYDVDINFILSTLFPNMKNILKFKSKSLKNKNE